MSSFRVLAGLAASALICVSATAAPVTWTLSGAKLNDGSTASGSFTYDAATNTYSDYGISYTAGSVRPAITYGASAMLHSISSEFNLLLTLASGSNYMNIAFDNALTDAGGTIALALDTGTTGLTISSWECNNCTRMRLFTAGSVTAAAAAQQLPEPHTLLLAGTLLAGLAATRRRA